VRPSLATADARLDAHQLGGADGHHLGAGRWAGTEHGRVGDDVDDGQGAAWAFAQVDEGTYQRTALTIADITGDTVLLTAGPAPGTEVVTVGAAELVGVEAGISGDE